MYPIGFMLGSSCSACCNQNPCNLCTTGSLPDTVTVTFDGFTDQTPGPDLISLSFSSCFGGGASARVTAPGGDPDTDKGPISGVSLTNAGSGYAKLGRVAPTISVSGGSGTGATFTPTVTSSNDACGVPSWKIASVAVVDGTGYVDGEQLTVSIVEGDTEAAAATVVVNTTRTEPTLTASASPGSGAVLAVTLSENYGGPPTTWGVASVSVTNGGTGYTDGDSLTFTGGSATKVNEEASAYIRTGRSIPTLSGGAAIPGSGAVLTPTLTEFTDYYTGRPYWSVTAFTITNGGSGYSEFDQVFIVIDDGTSNPWYPFSGYVSSVDENGAITGITIDQGGEFHKDTGVIESVDLWNGGSYYDDDGVPVGVTVENGGQYYREDASETPYVADITISITQTAPSDGAGAEITATVDDDTASPTFGRVTALTIDDGGDGYLAWKWVANDCCGWQLNGMPIVLKRGGEGRSPCRYWHRICGGWTSRLFGQTLRRSNGVMGIAVDYNGPSLPPTVSIIRTGVIVPDSGSSDDVVSPACAVVMTAEELIDDCGDFSFSAESIHGVTATVSPGGDYDENFKGKHGSASVPYTLCSKCCQGAEDVPQEIEVEVTDRGYYGGDKSGVYVLPGGGPSWGFSIPQDELGTVRFNVGVAIGEGSCGLQEACDQCVKQCEISAVCNYSYHPATWYAPSDVDMRDCPILSALWNPGDLTEQEYWAIFYSLYCEAYCFDVPLCSPPAGMEFSFFQKSGSENWGASITGPLCEPNDDPTWQDGDPWEGPYTGPPRPDHLNTFKLRVL